VNADEPTSAEAIIALTASLSIAFVNCSLNVSSIMLWVSLAHVDKLPATPAVRELTQSNPAMAFPLPLTTPSGFSGPVRAVWAVHCSSVIVWAAASATIVATRIAMRVPVMVDFAKHTTRRRAIKDHTTNTRKPRQRAAPASHDKSQESNSKGATVRRRFYHNRKPRSR
jgi:hypothetical protein